MSEDNTFEKLIKNNQFVIISDMTTEELTLLLEGKMSWAEAYAKYPGGENIYWDELDGDNE